MGRLPAVFSIVAGSARNARMTAYNAAFCPAWAFWERNVVSKTAAEIRQEFIDFFKERAHSYVPSSPVVPHDDPTLLFTNAGMNQFKDVFLGTGTRPYARAANSQKCIRAGGKHNDLDDVGHDTYHHTFFEMLGNWSFGDYFKRDAIAWAWELLTERWGLDPSRLHATYFGGDPTQGLEPDLEARDLWKELTGLPDEQIHPGDATDNFWEMGESGPCGPCSEIHIDLTADKTGARLVNAGSDQVIEIWNLVFIQFNRRPDKTLDPLPAKHVDTGMGFERIAAVIQGKRSNYDTDVFTPLFAEIQQVTGAPAYTGSLESGSGTASEQEMVDISYRVIADHIRTLTFALSDGAYPDKDGRGYVLRRILRRAVRYGWQYLRMHEPFLYKLVPAVVKTMGAAFPELRAKLGRVIEVVEQEERSFSKTLGRGIALFEEAADVARTQHHNEIRGEDAFKLHDTYGFPIDLTQIMAEERELRVDLGEYERLMEEARERARHGGAVQVSGFAALQADLVTPFGPTDDSQKYETREVDGTVRAMVLLDQTGGIVIRDDDQPILPGHDAGLIVDRTSFYGEQGGQVGDKGVIGGDGIRFDVERTRRFGDTVVHFGTLVQGEIRVGQTIRMTVDEHREVTKQNHTATHLLNWALRETLGNHIEQRGSLVDSERTRFDFSHPMAVSVDEIAKIESLVHAEIQKAAPVYAQDAPQQDAMKINGLRAVFGEKYPERVRVVSIGAAVDELLANPEKPEWRRHSIEFCGGTHVTNTEEIGHFAITVEEAVAKGIRRIVGVTGGAAQLMEQIGEALVQQAESLKGVTPEEAADGIQAVQGAIQQSDVPLRHRARIQEAIAAVQRTLKQARKADAQDAVELVKTRLDALLDEPPVINGTSVIVAEMPNVPAEQLKHGADIIKQKRESAAILFGVHVPAEDEDGGSGKVVLLAAMTDDLIRRGVKAGDLVKHVAPIVKGGGGGPPTMAQAGGKEPEKLVEALEAGLSWISERL